MTVFHLAEIIAHELVGDGLLLEDRVDDLIARYPRLKLTRSTIESWLEFDPTPNKKYLSWIVRQVAEKDASLPADGELIRDNLMTFERLLRIPAYQGQRDIQQLTATQLYDIVSTQGALKSKSEEERIKKSAGGKVIAQEGNLQLVEIKDSNTLVSWAWKAYSADNPNWDKPPVTPDKAKDISDHLWCVRFPHYAQSYLTNGPFHLVLKNGGPYVGIVLSRGECQTLQNKGISMAVAEEIYPLVKGILEGATLTSNLKVFENMRFLYGDVKDGETIAGNVDLAGTSITTLPDNLTVRGDLDISNTPIANLPSKLAVERTLKIVGTKLTTLPIDLCCDDMEWSDPLTWDQVKTLFYAVQLDDMKKHFFEHESVKKQPPEVQQAEWEKFKVELYNHFRHKKDVEENLKYVYRYVPQQAKKKAKKA